MKLTLVDDFGVKIQKKLSEKEHLLQKEKKVANNDFTGKKKVFMRGQFTYFFFLRSFCEKKRKTLEKKQGL